MDKDDMFEKRVSYLCSGEPAKCGVVCLLCGKFIETNIPRPIICKSCKELWQKIKEKYNG